MRKRLSLPRAPFETPIDANAVEGEVAITGPEHMHGSFTPDAARESAQRLTKLADEAESQDGPDPEAEGGV